MTTAFIILLLPLFAVAANLLFLRKRANFSAYISTLSAAICLVLTLGLIRQNGLDNHGSFNWVKIADFELNIGIELLGLGLGMIHVVTLIGFLVNLY